MLVRREGFVGVLKGRRWGAVKRKGLEGRTRGVDIDIGLGEGEGVVLRLDGETYACIFGHGERVGWCMEYLRCRGGNSEHLPKVLENIETGDAVTARGTYMDA